MIITQILNNNLVVWLFIMQIFKTKQMLYIHPLNCFSLFTNILTVILKKLFIFKVCLSIFFNKDISLIKLVFRCKFLIHITAHRNVQIFLLGYYCVNLFIITISCFAKLNWIKAKIYISFLLIHTKNQRS